MKLNVYIDGFNVYYGAVRGTPYKWLDLRALCERALSNHAVHRVKYFTADVKPRPNDPDQPNRQKAYLNALTCLPNVTIHKGLFKAGTRRLPLAPGEPNHPRTVSVMYFEEKGSDVNLATELLMDAFRNDFEGAVVLSDDSDLIAPIRAIRQLLQVPVGVMNPYPATDPRTGKRRLRRDLERACVSGNQQTVLFYQHLNHALLSQCQLPNPTSDPRTGQQYFKPKTW